MSPMPGRTRGAGRTGGRHRAFADRAAGLDIDELRIDLIGLNALHGPASPKDGEPYEVRLRVAARTQNRRHAEYVAQEIQALLTNGPYGGGGDFMQVRDLIGVSSLLLPRELVASRVEFAQ